ncbi:MAG TPA: matrixin family metalloprotease [Actinomycetota bacterium]|nr:matrixin family metalloprotease [Actinomycetota bacterium]
MAWQPRSDVPPPAPVATGWIPVPPRPDVRPSPPPPAPNRRRVIAGLALAGLALPILAVAIAIGAGRSHGDFAFLHTIPGTDRPVRWNPCQPIQYQVNTANAPPGAVTDVAEAAGNVTAASGVAFTFDGTTRRTATDQVRDAGVSNLAEHVSFPVLVSWLPDAQFQQIVHDRDVLAFTQPMAALGTGVEQYGSGVIVVDAGQDFASSGRYSLELVLQHEFGHLMGLDHVGAPDELMFSSEVAPHTAPDQIYGWGPGDRQGLELLGRDQGCLPAITVAP